MRKVKGRFADPGKTALDSLFPTKKSTKKVQEK
jgi:hypothetical protein